MRFLILLSLSLFLNNAVSAQQNHFIYLQSDNGQPFYVKLDKNVFSSSSTGYAIIPKLQKGDYDLTIGFPQNEFPTQKISVPVTNDAGYALKNFGDKGWGLFNFQSMQTLMAGTKTKPADVAKAEVVVPQETKKAEEVPAKKEVSKEVETVIVKNEPATVKEKTATETAISEVIPPVKAGDNKEEKIVSGGEQIIPPPASGENLKTVAKDAGVVALSPRDKNIKQLQSILDADGRSIVYTDNSQRPADTVTLFMPYDDVTPQQFVQSKEPATVINEAVPEDPTQQELIKDQVAEQKIITPSTKTEQNTTGNEKFLNMEIANPNSNPSTIKVETEPVAKEKVNQDVIPVEEKILVEKKAEKTVAAEPVFPMKKDNVKVEKKETTENKTTLVIKNTDCKDLADNDDFLRIRKNMAAQADEDNMVAEAYKMFKKKCYGTDQIRNLSVLFLTDKGKYQFFDKAYPFTHDPQNFIKLGSELTEAYYLTRFNAMIFR